jgi:hypothetical protein
MFVNQVQPDVKPEELACVEGQKILQMTKHGKRRATPATEEYFQDILMKEIKERHGDDLSKGSSHSSSNCMGKSCQISSCGESQEDTTLGEEKKMTKFDRILSGKAGLDFMSDIRCCLFLGLLIVVSSLSIAIYTVIFNGEEAAFYTGVSL